MRVLVIAEGYPSKNNLYNLAYIHSRLIHYVRNNIQVKVLSFQAVEPYEFEGIHVTNENDFDATDKIERYELIISHAPNLRHHVKFLLKNLKGIKQLMFFIHGHEVLIKENYYPAPFAFEKKSKLNVWLSLIYDLLKVHILKVFFTYVLTKKRAHIVFVSEWMEKEMLENVPLNPDLLKKNASIINNNIHPTFFEKSYQPHQEKWGDFITIRPLDNPKYAIDVVIKIAKLNPEYTFHVYGKGQYFDFNEKPDNLVWHNKYLKQPEIAETLNHYRCGLMPTRLDSQGVTVCEFASYGIPLYTSDLEICQEMLRGFENARFFSNIREDDYKKIVPFQGQLSMTNKQRFSFENTVYKEIDLIQNYFKRD